MQAQPAGRSGRALVCLVAIAGVALTAPAPGGGGDADAGYTTDFSLGARKFKPGGRNPYFSLHPGYQLVLMGEEDGEEIMVEITVLDETRTIEYELPNGSTRIAKTRVVQEREYADGELVEISWNYYARCKRSNGIYYFGEDVDTYEEGEVVSHDGAWLAGVDGALPGLIMPGEFLLGSRYFQEIAPDVAMDRAEHTAMDVTLETAAGIFKNCVVVTEDSPLEPGAESVKVYCRGVGLVRDDVVELVWFGYVGGAQGATGAEGSDEDEVEDDDGEGRGW
jgi:hypothetical protein